MNLFQFHVLTLNFFQAKLKEALENNKVDLPWIERLDLVNDMAELAPELAVEVTSIPFER